MAHGQPTTSTPWRKLRDNLARTTSYALVVLMPLDVRQPLAQPLAHDLPPLYSTPALYLADLAVVCMLLVAMTCDRFRPGTVVLTVPFLALIFLAGLSVPRALVYELAAYTAARWLIAAGVYLALVQDEAPPDRIVAMLVAGLCLNTLVGVAQIAAQGPVGIPGELALAAADKGASIVVVGQARWLRAYGMTLHPNVLGGFLMVGLVLTLPLLERRRARLAWWLLMVGLLLSFSRSAWLATALTLPSVAGWLAWGRPALRRPICVTLVGSALIVLVFATALAGALQSRLRPTAVAAEARSLSERADMIAIALRIIADRPLTGVGAGDFPVAMREFGTTVEPQYVHHVPLLLAAEVGVAGGALYAWLWLAPILAMRQHWRGINPWPITIAGAWLGLGFVALWDSYPWGLNSGLLLTVTLLGLLSRSLASPTS